MKKNLLIASIAGVTALSGIAAFTMSTWVQAADLQTSTKTAIQKMRTKTTDGKQAHGGRGVMEGRIMWFGGGDKWGFGMWGQFGGENSAVIAAIATNDYDAFVTALNADTNKPTDAKTPTQEQFTKMVSEYNKHKTVEAAIDANDYNAYVTATTPTQAEFTEIVAKHTQQKAMQTAITNKDYNAYVAALKVDTNRPTDAKTPTQEEFTKMIERKDAKAVKASSKTTSTTTK